VRTGPRKRYSNKCSYFKSRGLCRNRFYKRRCQQTCGICAKNRNALKWRKVMRKAKKKKRISKRHVRVQRREMRIRTTYKAPYESKLRLRPFRTFQSGTARQAIARRAVDGRTVGRFSRNSCTHTKTMQNPWWVIDLKRKRKISSVTLYNRSDCCGKRLAGVKVVLGMHKDGRFKTSCGHVRRPQRVNRVVCGGKKGRFVKVFLPSKKGSLVLCEVQIAILTGGGKRHPINRKPRRKKKHQQNVDKKKRLHSLVVPKPKRCHDRSRFSKPYFEKLFKQKRFRNRCAYDKSRGMCRYKSYRYTRCRRTCTRRGSDKIKYSRHRFLGKIKTGGTTRHQTKCAYWKAKKFCRFKWLQAKCLNTCGKCQNKAMTTCRDRSRYSRPIQRRKFRKRRFQSKCRWIKARYPRRCKQKYYKSRCRRTCTGVFKDGWTRPFYGPMPTGVTRRYRSTCDFWRKQGRCKHIWTRRSCKATCRACKAPKKASRFFKHRWYKRRPMQKTKKGRLVCQDRLRFRRPFKKFVFKRTRFKSKCLWVRKTRRCAKAFYKGRVCQKTCTGKGRDHRNYRRPAYRSIKTRKFRRYGSRCAYWASLGKCRASHAIRKRCPKSCKMCGKPKFLKKRDPKWRPSRGKRRRLRNLRRKHPKLARALARLKVQRRAKLRAEFKATRRRVSVDRSQNQFHRRRVIVKPLFKRRKKRKVEWKKASAAQPHEQKKHTSKTGTSTSGVSKKVKLVEQGWLRLNSKPHKKKLSRSSGWLKMRKHGRKTSKWLKMRKGGVGRKRRSMPGRRRLDAKKARSAARLKFKTKIALARKAKRNAKAKAKNSQRAARYHAAKRVDEQRKQVANRLARVIATKKKKEKQAARRVAQRQAAKRKKRAVKRTKRRAKRVKRRASRHDRRQFQKVRVTAAALQRAKAAESRLTASKQRKPLPSKYKARAPKRLVPGMVVTLRGKGARGRYCRASPKGAGCGRLRVGYWERFLVVDAGNGAIALRGGQHKCLNFRRHRVTCGRQHITNHAPLTVTILQRGELAMKQVSTKRYCTTGRRLKCNANNISRRSTFRYACIRNCSSQTERPFKLGDAGVMQGASHAATGVGLVAAPAMEAGAENGEAWLTGAE